MPGANANAPAPGPASGRRARCRRARRAAGGSDPARVGLQRDRHVPVDERDRLGQREPHAQRLRRPSVGGRPITSPPSIVTDGLRLRDVQRQALHRASSLAGSNSPLSSSFGSASPSTTPRRTSRMVAEPTRLGVAARSRIAGASASRSSATRSSTASSRPPATCAGSSVLAARVDDDEVEAAAEQPAGADAAVVAEPERRARCGARRAGARAGVHAGEGPQRHAAGVDVSRPDLDVERGRAPSRRVRARAATRSTAGMPVTMPWRPRRRTAPASGATCSPRRCTRSRRPVDVGADAAGQQRRDGVGDLPEHRQRERRQPRDQRRRRVGGPGPAARRPEVACRYAARGRRRARPRASRPARSRPASPAWSAIASSIERAAPG